MSQQREVNRIYCFRDIKETQKETIPIKSINFCDYILGLSRLVLENLLLEKDKTRALLKTHLFALKGCSDPSLAKIALHFDILAKQSLYAFQERPVTNKNLGARPVRASLHRGLQKERSCSAGAPAGCSAFLHRPPPVWGPAPPGRGSLPPSRARARGGAWRPAEMPPERGAGATSRRGGAPGQPEPRAASL